MKTSYSTEEKFKFMDLVGEMLRIITGQKCLMIPDYFADEYIKNVLKIDDDNPIKELLLLEQSFIDKNVIFVIEASDELKKS